MTFTIHSSPFTMHYPFSVYHGKPKTVNAWKTVNGKPKNIAGGTR
jgi:hypothetical protein